MNRLARHLALAAAAVAVPCTGIDMDELEVDHALTFDIQTPHTDWAQPYARGKTRVLFFTNGRGTVPRECVELMQRFDLEAEAVFWARIVDSRNEHWHGGSLGEKRMLALLEKPWDCYVFFDMNPTKLSAEQQVKILEPVTKGAGLVLRGANDNRIFKSGNKLQAPPPILKRGPAGEAYTIGKGRGVVLPKQPDIPYAQGWEMQYDYWAERCGRAILWAAGKEPGANVKVTFPEPDIAQGDTTVMTIATVGTYSNDNLTLKTRLRRPGGPLMDFPERDIRPGRGITLRIPELPAGEYAAEAWIVSKHGVEAWTSKPLSVSSQRALSEPVLKKTWGEIGETISGSVSIEGFPYPNEVLRVRILDTQRRELLRHDSPVKSVNANLPFTFETKPWMPMLLTVEAQLLTSNREVTRSSARFRLVKRHRGKFNFLIWDVPKGPLAPYAEKILAETGVTLQLSHANNPPAFAAANDIAWVPYTTRILANLDPKGTMKPFCWNNEDAVTKHVRQKAADYAGARQHGIFVWSLGDEVHTKGSCLSSHCAKAYAAYLREQYPSVQALNQSWGTTFDTWEDVGLSDPKDNDETASLRAVNYPRWFDRQAFKAWNFVQFCNRYREAYEDADPKARVGFEGAGRFDRGDDIDLIVRNNTFWSPYPGTADEVIRSIAPRDFPRANWMGYTKDADSLLLKYWRMVTRGMDSVWWWRWDCIGRFHGWLAPDLRPFPAVREILEDTQILRDGLGDLLLQSNMQEDGIAMLYSYPSSLIHKHEDGSSFGGYESAHKAAHNLVRELGFQFRYVTDRMVRNGEARPREWKVLLLPRAEAMSKSETEAVRAFVENGGLVIADVRTAIFDHHCKPRNTGGALDGLFGIKRTGNPPALVAKDTPYGTLKLDPGVRVTDGSAAFTVDGCPAFITRRTGKGIALFLNFDFTSFPNPGLPTTPETHAREMALRFADVELLPEYTLLNEHGQRARNVEVTRWKNGGMELVSLFRRGGTAENLTVVLPENAVVYDLRQRTGLGMEKRFVTRVIPNRATFLAVCPRKIPRPILTVQPGQASRGTVVNARIQVPGTQGKQAFRIRLGAEGTILDSFTQVVVTDSAGNADIQIPVAYNDPIGTYEIFALNVITNSEFHTRFLVR